MKKKMHRSLVTLARLLDAETFDYDIGKTVERFWKRRRKDAQRELRDFLSYRKNSATKS